MIIPATKKHTVIVVGPISAVYDEMQRVGIDGVLTDVWHQPGTRSIWATVKAAPEQLDEWWSNTAYWEDDPDAPDWVQYHGTMVKSGKQRRPAGAMGSYYPPNPANVISE